MPKIALVDDHFIVRQGLEFLLSTQPQIEVVGSFGEGQALLDALATDQIEPELILVDLVMPEMNGITLIQKLKEQHTGIKILVLTSYVDEEHVMSAMQAGADGYEMKDVDPEALMTSIETVLQGDKVIHKDAQQVMDTVITKPHMLNKLSKRETEVLKEMAKGKTNKEIAETLFVSEKTIKTHVSHIFSKLEVTDRTQAAIYAMENHLV
ncbi:response regulator transcription factor [Staphylococcus pseudintermedius]|uniref:DNA-binding response regulator n=2 Tax=Staphylococcus pseudintermedius TaxID=283734 RepID=A0A3D8ZCP6_STAPS|nr:response regulator transcription factor [Staphylococcus pseudintermedius]ADX76237.1 two-component response regulator [Staphylococcus pseudintermedius ED99]EGQ0298461.1 response regulator transcription factor [Staphylococcus pseudintermedius]EGQ0305385.1 response regulator transcription factor [Staphylococcus pseudintermedius]EGQ0307628.1 response regulator transcription factor [Staphylococcus pseudintermedius]EGQ0309689.1 response regulator transcription factor [Staphylococcus pseudintermed